MTKRIVLLISIVLGVLFIANVTFATHAVENFTEGVRNAGANAGRAVERTVEHAGERINDMDGRDGRRDDYARREQDRRSENFHAIRTNAPYTTTSTTTSQIVMWTAVTIAGLVIIAVVWRYATQTNERRTDRD